MLIRQCSWQALNGETIVLGSSSGTGTATFNDSAAVTVDPPALSTTVAQFSAGMLADFPVGSPSPAAMPTQPTNAPTNLAMLDPAASRSMVMPLHSIG